MATANGEHRCASAARLGGELAAGRSADEAIRVATGHGRTLTAVQAGLATVLVSLGAG